MERNTEKDLHWLMASYSGIDAYGPSRRVFRYEVPQARVVLHNFGNHYHDEWRIGLQDPRGNVRAWVSCSLSLYGLRPRGAEHCGRLGTYAAAGMRVQMWNQVPRRC